MEKESQEESNHIIKLDQVGIYQMKHQVLSDVNIQVDNGEFVFLIGKNGSGKSSFLKTLYAELKLTEGTGSVTNISLNKIKSKNVPKLRRKIGIVFQDFQLLTDRSIFENLKFVLKATGWKNKQEISERIQEVLSHVNLVDKLYNFPHELSGGEQQRIAIARSLLNDPELILADEPTGNLDPETSEEIMKILFSLSKEGKAVIMASHDYDLMKAYASRVLKFEGGKIIEANL